MKSRAYRAVDVNRIDANTLLQEREETLVHAGLDVGKESIYCTLRWGVDDFDRPWRVGNPRDVGRLAALLSEVERGRKLVAALEPTGTYGDALRQALERAAVTVHRVSPKSASDYAEIFDGVPSQHDGKDAAVVAELAAQGKSWPWPLPTPTEVEQELAYHVEGMDAHRRQMTPWYGQLEALLSRHWPEAARVLPLRTATLWHCLLEYGGPEGLAGAADGVGRVQSWGGKYLSPDKAQALVESARHTAGVKMGPWDQEAVRRCVREMQRCQKEVRLSRRRLCVLTRGHGTIAAMGEVVGVPTACVLWVELGDPQAYQCGAAYRKAMGLNLAERSSGQWQGKLKISKRGSSKVRRWLYMAALRWSTQEPVRSWYLRQKTQRRGEGMPALIGIMRKLALVLFHVGGHGEVFDRNKVYQRLTAEPCEQRSSQA